MRAGWLLALVLCLASTAYGEAQIPADVAEYVESIKVALEAGRVREALKLAQDTGVIRDPGQRDHPLVHLMQGHALATVDQHGPAAAAYRAVISQNQARRAALRGLVDRAFGGAFGSLVQHMADEEPLSSTERKRLMRWLDAEERGERDGPSPSKGGPKRSRRRSS